LLRSRNFPKEEVELITPFSAVYVTDNGEVSAVGGGASNFSAPAIYSYDLDEEMLLCNRTLFGQAREGIADGIHVDDAGRVWTAEGEGIV
jgi:gluconolactonase